MKKILLLLVLVSTAVYGAVVYYGDGEAVFLEDRLKFEKSGTTIDTNVSSGVTQITSPTFSVFRVLDQFGTSLSMVGNTLLAESGGGDASMTLQHQPGGSINRFDGTTYSKLGANPDYQELMKHPSFELDHEGVCSNCTASLAPSITPTPEDKNRLELVFSGAGTYTVDIETGAGFAGLPATASCYVNTTNTDVQMAQRTNGVNGATENVVSGGSEVLIKPSAQGLAGTTSTGYQIIAGSAGTVYLNNCSINTEDNVYQVGIDSDWVDCGLEAADFTGFGTVTSIEDSCRRDGPDLLMNVKFTSGSSTGTEARVNLKLNGGALIASSLISANTLAGGARRGINSDVVYNVLSQPNVGYLTLSRAGAIENPLTPQNGDILLSSAQPLAFTARIPIQGWTAGQDALSSTNSNTTITKVLSADVSTNGTTLSDLTFTDLVIGAEYEVNLKVNAYPGSGGFGGVRILHNSTEIGNSGIFVNTSSSGYISSTVVKFKAQTNTLTFVTTFSGTGTINGNGTQSQTFAQLRRIDGQFNATLRDVVKSPGSSNGKPVILNNKIDASEAITSPLGDSLFISSCTDAAPSVCTLDTAVIHGNPECWSQGASSYVSATSSTTVTVERADNTTPFSLFCKGLQP